jgi:hypothetical protein
MESTEAEVRRSIEFESQVTFHQWDIIIKGKFAGITGISGPMGNWKLAECPFSV